MLIPSTQNSNLRPRRMRLGRKLNYTPIDIKKQNKIYFLVLLYIYTGNLASLFLTAVIISVSASIKGKRHEALAEFFEPVAS